ncbi:Uncharacterized protein C824.03c, mitochondrial [Geodia barretti]|uniref:Uncharacterized protein C824.03c, mitochondrial n=1 Tax=Geodia barretti TaxID=519541 RepID=A0AA35S2M1_GEOBA|nr:Uncharacterized protein C824.03c, mitochondrial [Geodia barretti]
MLQQLSTVAVGRAYELLVLAVLRRYSFQLYHSGRRGDGGVDFVGHWALTPAARLDIVGQCKWRHRTPLNPGEVRELESVVARMTGPRKTPYSVAGLLASYSGFSRQAMQTGMNSEVPLILTQIRPLPPEDNYDIIGCKNDVIPTGHQSVVEEESGYIRDFVLNHTAQTLWPNIKVTWRHSRETGRKIDILVQKT